MDNPYWEQRKLSYYLQTSLSKNEEDMFSKKDVLSVSGEFGIVNQIEFQGRSFAGASVKNYGIVDIGDVVYTKSPLKVSPYGIIKANKGKPGIVSTLYAVYKPTNNVIPSFVQCYFENNSRLNNYLKPLVNKGAKNDMKVSDENALKGIVRFPNIDEQKTIADFLDKFDTLITLHQRKLDDLKELKKGLLQKLFPVTVVMFLSLDSPGFTEPWEQRKLGDCIQSVYNGQTPSRSIPENWGGQIPWLTSGELNRSHVKETVERITLQGQKEKLLRIVPAGTFIIAITGLEAAGTRGNCALLDLDSTLNQSCMAIFPNERVVSDFLFHWYKKVGEYYGIRLTQGTKQQSYNAEIIKKIPITLPGLSEQLEIANFFDEFDSLITLHQRQPFSSNHHCQKQLFMADIIHPNRQKCFTHKGNCLLF